MQYYFSPQHLVYSWVTPSSFSTASQLANHLSWHQRKIDCSLANGCDTTVDSIIKTWAQEGKQKYLWYLFRKHWGTEISIIENYNHLSALFEKWQHLHGGIYDQLLLNFGKLGHFPSYCVLLSPSKFTSAVTIQMKAALWHMHWVPIVHADALSQGISSHNSDQHHHDIINWKHFRLLVFVRGIHRSLVNFLWSVPQQMVEKQLRRWWSEMSSHSLWCHCNGSNYVLMYLKF